VGVPSVRQERDTRGREEGSIGRHKNISGRGCTEDNRKGNRWERKNPSDRRERIKSQPSPGSSWGQGKVKEGIDGCRKIKEGNTNIKT